MYYAKLSLKLKMVEKQKMHNTGKDDMSYLQTKDNASGFGVSWREAVVMHVCFEVEKAGCCCL